MHSGYFFITFLQRTHKILPIVCPQGQTMGCHLWDKIQKFFWHRIMLIRGEYVQESTVSTMITIQRHIQNRTQMASQIYSEHHYLYSFESKTSRSLTFLEHQLASLICSITSHILLEVSVFMVVDPHTRVTRGGSQPVDKTRLTNRGLTLD